MQSLFDRTVFRSANGDSEYDPHTYTMRFSGEYPDRAFGVVALHETMHWIQHICYTFGGFQSALIHGLDEYAKKILGRYAKLKGAIQHQVTFSLPQNKKTFFNLTFDYERQEKEIWLWQCAWRDMLICKHLFLHMSSFYKKYDKEMSTADKALQPELLIPRTLVGINNWAIGTLCYKSTETKGCLRFNGFDNYPKLINFGQAIHKNIELDTNNIIEGMPVVFEVYSLGMMGANVSTRMKEIINTSYSPAIEIFLEIIGLSVNHDNVVKMAIMFLAIAEMSLNPPLPPFGTINKLELDWNKIYPPLRFIELCHIAKRVIEISGVPDHTDIPWVLAWSSAVESLYLVQGGLFSYLSKDIDGYLPAAKAAPFLCLIAEENADMRDILRHKGVNTIGMVERFAEVFELSTTGLELYAMLRQAHGLFVNWLGIPRPFLIPCEGNYCSPWLNPPLLIFDDDILTSAWSEDFAKYLIEYNLFHYPLHNIMLRSKEPHLSLPKYPMMDDEKRNRHWDRLQKFYSYIF